MNSSLHPQCPSISLYDPTNPVNLTFLYIFDMFLKMSTTKPNLSELGHLEVWIQLFQMDVGCVVAIADVQQHLAQHKTGNKSVTSSLRAWEVLNHNFGHSQFNNEVNMNVMSYG